MAFEFMTVASQPPKNNIENTRNKPQIQIPRNNRKLITFPVKKRSVI